MDAPVRLADRRSRFDPTGRIVLEDRHAVETAVRAILDRHYAGSYDVALLGKAMDDVARAYRGEYPGLLRCDALYHDLRHSLETALTMARLLDGYAAEHAPGAVVGIAADHALLGVLLALFHDIGLLRRDSEADLWGPSLTPIHEERGVEFMHAYLPDTTLAALAGASKLIMATKLVYVIPGSWTAGERRLASMVATADLISQTLLEKTPAFVEGYLHKRMDVEFQGVRRYLRSHFSGADPWEEAIQRNLGYLKTLLENKELDRLRRNPTRYIGDQSSG